MATSVTLLHNPTAGYENYPKEKLLEILQKNGYKTTYVDIKGEDFMASLNSPGDLVVIAGGDGTVIKVTRHLIGKRIPIGLLPLGTANNIAAALKISGKPENIVAAWNPSRSRPFFPGLIIGPEGERTFMESAGFGILTRLFRREASGITEANTREAELERARRHQLQILKEYKSHFCTILVDGQEFSGNYILIEAMNIPFAGPNSNLAPQADPGDDFLEVVLVKEDEREQLEEFLSRNSDGKDHTTKLPVLRAKKLKIEWNGIHHHLDDEFIESKTSLSLNMQVNPEGLEFLVV